MLYGREQQAFSHTVNFAAKQTLHSEFQMRFEIVNKMCVNSEQANQHIHARLK